MVNCLPMKDFIIFNHSPFTWRCFQNSFKKIRQSCLKILNKSSYKNAYPQDNIPFIKRTIVSRSIYIYPIYLYINILYIEQLLSVRWYSLDYIYLIPKISVHFMCSFLFIIFFMFSWGLLNLTRGHT